MPVGDEGVRLPHRFVARCIAEDFVVVLQLEVVDGVVELDEMLVSRRRGRPPIGAATLPNNVPLGDVVQQATRLTAAYVEVEETWFQMSAEQWEADPPVLPRDLFRVPTDRQGAIERAVPKRQRISGTFLRNVVDAYNSAREADDGSDPYEVVGRAFGGKSPKTAQRWMTIARKRGIAGTDANTKDSED